MKRNPPQYFAAIYPLGAGAREANTGRAIRSIYVFDSKARRDEFVRKGSDYRSGSNWREAIRAPKSKVDRDIAALNSLCIIDRPGVE